MTMGRKAFLASATLGLGGLVAGCSPQFGPGGAGANSLPEAGPADVAEVLEQAQVADLPPSAVPVLTDPSAPEGYEWAREVSFAAPEDDVDRWLEDSFGSIDAAPRVFVLNAAVAEAFDVDEVPDTWRSLRQHVPGTRLDLMLLIDDAPSSTVRLHLRRRAD